MNIREIKVKPQLVEITLDDKSIVDAYKEEIKFFMYDHTSIPTYFAFFKAQSEGDTSKLLDLMREMILAEKGNKVIDKDYTLPIDIFTACVFKVTDHLGKFVTKNSTPTETGTQQ